MIDDHELFSTALIMALRGEGLHTFAVSVSDVGRFLGDADADTGLVVLDLDLGQDAEGTYRHGADLVGRLRERGWAVLVVSGSVDEPGTAGAIAGGAIGSVPKSSSFDVLLPAARGVPLMTEAERREWVDLHRHYLARERELSRRLARLSRREREVLELLAEGRRAAAVAERLVVSMPTVRTQIRSILTKLEVSSQLEAVALFRQQPDTGRGRRA
ncbi:LuxR C-terminal-related transcriptional regulator [Actinomycetospora sp. NBRC 106378]|uniref:LuxR C-terminal-related transcriptional regulator n=1 Tax=Actinomycetospora sp. NBRC 106378 TaxID=3032208 RepID=UPI00255768F9|nr:LuxR C-terminal-related transcriptional regulator [Actinomycetospora sp. NBRC 106378]